VSVKVLLPALLLAALGSAFPAAAQDAHYWTYGYGPIGQLTEGTLVGGVEDVSATYYNPGALALIREPRFVFGLTSIELATITARNAAGQNLDFNSHVFDVIPAMVAGHVGHDGSRPDQFAFAFLSRHDTDWDIGYSNDEVSPDSPDASAGYGRVRERVVEYWFGGTWSHRIREGFSLGVSPFVAFRLQRSRRSLSLEDVADGASRAVFVGSENEYTHVRALAKLGAAWRPGRLKLGATVTTPGLAVYGRGSTVFNASIVCDVAPSSLCPSTAVLAASINGQASLPLLSASSQDGLSATYRSPWSVAAGATWSGSRTAIHTTVEWFSAVEPYDILSPAPAPVAGSPATIPLTFRGAAKSVVDFGAGFERRLGAQLTLYGGAARNASPWRPESETLASWDLVDATAGVSLDRGRSRLALGVGYSWGSGQLPRVIVPPDATGQRPATEARFSRWTVSVAASLDGAPR